jgi:hypothetical protein
VVGTLVHLFLQVRRLDALRPIDGTPGLLAKFLAIVVVTGPGGVRDRAERVPGWARWWRRIAARV